MQNLNESSLARIWSKTQDHDCAMLTAFRGEFSKQENLQRNRQLLGLLKAAGYSVTYVRGAYIENKGTPEEREVKENSFFVQNYKDDPKFVKVIEGLGVKYKQDSVLIIPKGGKGAYLLGTSNNKDAFPPKGQKHNVGNATYGKVTQEYFSRIGGRGFEFKDASVIDEQHSEVYEKLNPMTLWAKSLAQKKSFSDFLKIHQIL